MPRLVRGFSLLSAYQKATTKTVVANFILPLIMQTLAYRFCFGEAIPHIARLGEPNEGTCTDQTIHTPLRAITIQTHAEFRFATFGLPTADRNSGWRQRERAKRGKQIKKAMDTLRNLLYNYLNKAGQRDSIGSVTGSGLIMLRHPHPRKRCPISSPAERRGALRDRVLSEKNGAINEDREFDFTPLDETENR